MLTPVEWILVGTALFTSTVSGTMGMGGGILLMMVMASYFPPLVLIPLHGCVQLASNVSRSIIQLSAIRWEIAGSFALGAVFGAALGSQFVVEVPEDIFRIGIGSFVLFLTHFPKLKNVRTFKGKWIVVGGGATFLSLFVGATGPLIAPFYLREGLKKEPLVATKAICQASIHTLKVITFFALGVSLAEHVRILVLMVLTVPVGNYIGKHLLRKVPEKLFQTLFKILITLLALRLMAKGIWPEVL